MKWLDVDVLGVSSPRAVTEHTCACFERLRGANSEIRCVHVAVRVKFKTFSNMRMSIGLKF